MPSRKRQGFISKTFKGHRSNDGPGGGPRLHSGMKEIRFHQRIEARISLEPNEGWAVMAHFLIRHSNGPGR